MIKPTETPHNYQYIPYYNRSCTTQYLPQRVVRRNENKEIISITEYNISGQITYCKNDSLEYSYEYDHLGRTLHYKDYISGYEYWNEYNNEGHLILQKDSNGLYETFELEYHPLSIPTVFGQPTVFGEAQEQVCYDQKQYTFNFRDQAADAK
jgi:hypothetical protein